MKQDKIRGCLVAGAIGDALGYPVEFLKYREIQREFGPEGIQGYALNESGKAVISDDTQMTLFTANGLLSGESAGKMKKSHWCSREQIRKNWRRKRKKCLKRQR